MDKELEFADSGTWDDKLRRSTGIEVRDVSRSLRFTVSPPKKTYDELKAENIELKVTIEKLRVEISGLKLRVDGHEKLRKDLEAKDNDQTLVIHRLYGETTKSNHIIENQAKAIRTLENKLSSIFSLPKKLAKVEAAEKRLEQLHKEIEILLQMKEDLVQEHITQNEDDYV